VKPDTSRNAITTPTHPLRQAQDML